MKKIGYIFLIALFAIAAIMPDGATASAPRGRKKRNKEIRIEWSETKIDST